VTHGFETHASVFPLKLSEQICFHPSRPGPDGLKTGFVNDPKVFPGIKASGPDPLDPDESRPFCARPV